MSFLKALGEKGSAPVALVALNWELLDWQPMARLWGMASLTLCADGGSNRLFDLARPDGSRVLVPDFIVGDMDSIRPGVRSFYEEQGSSVCERPDQDKHDLDKCLHVLDERQRVLGTRFTVLVVGALDGRLDQQMANLNMGFRWKVFERLIFASRHCLATILSAGVEHRLHPVRGFEGPTCGLLPIGGRCEEVHTTGLRWNLEGRRPLAFGELVSSSNAIEGETVTVRACHPIVWTTEVHWGALQL